MLRPMLEINPPVCDAVILFSKFAPHLGMNDQAIQLITRLKAVNEINQQQTLILNKALMWLAR